MSANRSPGDRQAPDGATGLPEPGQEAGRCTAVGGRDAPGRGGRGVPNHENPRDGGAPTRRHGACRVDAPAVLSP